MGSLIEGVKALFKGSEAPDTKGQKEAVLTEQARQKQILQNQQAEDEGEISRARRSAGKGRQLLFAATGEGGVSDKLG